MRVAVVVLLSACSSGFGAASVPPATTAAELGKLVFHDTGLSQPAGQACADCHASASAFRDPETDHTSSMGVVAGRFGSRNSPTAMYTAQVPALHYDAVEHGLVGGLFWDGRADSLELQAAGPLMNPLEMNNSGQASVVDKLRLAPYGDEFRAVYGDDALDNDDTAFAHLTNALGAYERSPELAPFTSKYDRFLAGKEVLTASEERGHKLFDDPTRGNCASCHPDQASAAGPPPMFTNFAYANLGVPAYRNNLFLVQPARFNPDGAKYRDRGLGRTTDDPTLDGQFRVPTLRNIARTAPYGHNGYFANLTYFIEFLATRDVGSPNVGTCSRAPTTPTASCAWPPAEFPATVDHHVGHLDLSPTDIDDLVAFLETLTDAS
ncbi:MAG TPA: cytochrome c peroxidase [Kofleriaceae bacterium]